MQPVRLHFLEIVEHGGRLLGEMDHGPRGQCSEHQGALRGLRERDEREASFAAQGLHQLRGPDEVLKRNLLGHTPEPRRPGVAGALEQPRDVRASTLLQ